MQMGEKGTVSRVWWAKLNKTRHLETLDVEGRYIKMDFKEKG
jgi:hypothetical protein